MYDYLYNNPRPTRTELNAHDTLIRDCLAGDERLRLRATQYIRKPEAMNSTQWNNYLKGAAYVNTPRHTLATWCGAANRKAHVVESPVPVDFRVEDMHYDGDALLRHAIYQVLSLGRAVYYVDPTGYIVHYSPKAECEIVFADGRLCKAVLQEDDGTRLELYIDVEGFAAFRYTDNEGVTREEREGRLIRAGKPITYLPLVCINAHDLYVDRDLSPLVDICKMSLNHWDLALSQAAALYYCANPQFAVFGITDQTEVPTVMGPGSVWKFSNPAARAELISYNGPAIADRREEMRRLEAAQAAAGAHMMLSRSDAHTVAKTKEMTQRASTSDLVEILKNIGEGIAAVLRHLADLKGADVNAVKVAPNLDLLDAAMESNMVRSLTEAYNNGLLSAQTWFTILQRGEIIPDGLSAEDEQDLIKDDNTVLLGRKTLDRMIDKYPDGENDNDTGSEA